MTADVDAVVIGGGPAGLSAALTLGRGRLKVLVVDGGEPRNVKSHAAHSFFTRDGVPPAELRAIGRDQLSRYDVRFHDGDVESISGTSGAFVLHIAGGQAITARRIVLATGVRDVFPDIPGLAERFGTSIFHCPYCDGWEVRDQRLATIAPLAFAAEHPRLIQNWSADTMLFTHGEVPESGVVETLLAAGIPTEPSAIAGITGEAGNLRVALEDGRVVERDALFVVLRQAPRTDLARALGCEVTTEGWFSGLLVVDAMNQTTVPGVFAAGDVMMPMQQISLAVASGTLAAAALHRSLLTERWQETAR